MTEEVFPWASLIEAQKRCEISMHGLRRETSKRFMKLVDAEFSMQEAQKIINCMPLATSYLDE